MFPAGDDDFMFTSESVTEGHPDKVADRVSDAVLDAALRQDPDSRVACETMITTGLVVVAGEITTAALLDVDQLVRDTIRDIGYDNDESGFDARTCGVTVALDKQSPDIAQGVNAAYESRGNSVESGSTEVDKFDLIGAGDQGMMFGYATRETPELMPAPIALAHRLSRRLADARKSGDMPYLLPDGKTQVTVRYSGGVPVEIEKILISAQHRDGAESQLLDDVWNYAVLPCLPADLYDSERLLKNFYVNPTGRFVKGGPAADCGLTGRKIIVDTYGGMARHGGGALSGKDPSKVDRSAAYAARYVAKNLVAAGLVDRVEVQIAYAIGMARPFSVLVETFGTEKVPRQRLVALVKEHFDLRPGAFREYLDLQRPIYQSTSAYGHFGREEKEFTWERTDRADLLRHAAQLDAIPEQKESLQL